MNRIRRFIFMLPILLLIACQSIRERDTIADLQKVRIEITGEQIDDGLEKAMHGYRRFLEETPRSALTPEAIRRLADLKIEKEYGITKGGRITDEKRSAELPAPRTEKVAATLMEQSPARTPSLRYAESEAEFERRAVIIGATDHPFEGGDDLENPSAREAIALYRKLLDDYPAYERNDQVLYQLSRAYEELGQTEEAMAVMDLMVQKFPQSRYSDEVQFRRAEHFFAHRRFIQAEEAYASIVDTGVGSFYFTLALYKLGWTFYKQELYEEALDRFVALLDHKISMGYDFAQTEDEQEKKRTEDTLRVISLGFSNLGNADTVAAYFDAKSRRSYEDLIYSNLAEFYFDKRRYADAAATYEAFVHRNPFHHVAPNFHMRTIEILVAGGFPSLVLSAKKAYAANYGLQSPYWKHFEPETRGDVLAHLKTNLTDLANHYHACYQDPRLSEQQETHFLEALQWYRAFLNFFPMASESPAINRHLADLLMENKSFGLAAVEYEKTAYDYPLHAESGKAGYAAVYAFRQELAVALPQETDAIRREVVRSSLRFADIFPNHAEASIVLGAAADDLYAMREYEQALAAGRQLIARFPDSDLETLRAAWLVVGHASYELMHYCEAEAAYLQVLLLLPASDKTRDTLVDNLAAAIYKQGEQADAAEDFRSAADHFMRVGRLAPTSGIRPNAEYDAAAALIRLGDWSMAAQVLEGFRGNFPDHVLQPEVTQKIAYVYRQDGRLSLAAKEYERIETESRDDDIRREALLTAAELHEADGNPSGAQAVYRRYVDYFPKPVSLNLETRNKIAEFLKANSDPEAYLQELARIVALDADAGSERTLQTRQIAARAALELAESTFERFTAVKLTKPFEVNLQKKHDLMKTATQAFGRLVDYELGDITAAATFYLADIYAHFSSALNASERPEGLSAVELEQYELAIEEQAYPFEEKAIAVHESNLQLISRGVYNTWIDKSIQKLAQFMPARYDKPEAPSGIVASLDTYIYAIDRPEPVDSPPSDPAGTAAKSDLDAAGEDAIPGVEAAAPPIEIDAAVDVDPLLKQSRR